MDLFLLIKSKIYYFSLLFNFLGGGGREISLSLDSPTSVILCWKMLKDIMFYSFIKKIEVEFRGKKGTSN